jgi:GT2 family glycosyltransferase
MSAAPLLTPTAEPTAGKVVVVVLNWCGESDTAACLRSLAASDYDDLHVLLVDNGSPDGSGDRLHRAFPSIPYVQTGRNLGFTGGNNRGIAWACEAGAEFVVVLNNDTVVAPDCITRLVAAARTGDDVGAVAPTMLIHDAPDRIWYAGGTLSVLRGAGRHDGEGEPHVGPDADAAPRPVTFVTGCCVLLTRRALATVGGFDDGYFAYVEDVDLSYRLTRAGFRLLHEPRAHLLHRVPVEVAEPSPFQIVQRDRNRRRFVRLRLSVPRRVAFAAWFYPTRAVHLARYVARGDWQRARAIWTGMCR